MVSDNYDIRLLCGNIFTYPLDRVASQFSCSVPFYVLFDH